MTTIRKLAEPTRNNRPTASLQNSDFRAPSGPRIKRNDLRLFGLVLVADS